MLIQGLPQTTLRLDDSLERLTDLTESFCLMVKVIQGKDVDSDQTEEERHSVEPRRVPSAEPPGPRRVESGGCSVGTDV